jgi:GxxExxY protein
MEYKYSDITEKIIKCAYDVYNKLGSGFLEKVYENSLFFKLIKLGLKAEQQYPIKVSFENEIVGEFFADLLVEDKVIVELKAIQELNEIHEAQLINYLKATKIEIGLLINFGPKIQIKRRIYTKNSENQINQ